PDLLTVTRLACRSNPPLFANSSLPDVQVSSAIRYSSHFFGIQPTSGGLEYTGANDADKGAVIASKVSHEQRHKAPSTDALGTKLHFIIQNRDCDAEAEGVRAFHGLRMTRCSVSFSRAYRIEGGKTLRKVRSSCPKSRFSDVQLPKVTLRRTLDSLFGRRKFSYIANPASRLFFPALSTLRITREGALNVMFLASLTLVSSCILAHALSPYVLHEKRSAPPAGWNLVRKFDADEVLPLRFGLKQTNLDKLDDWLLEVSHPESPKYSSHWTPAQVADSFAPSQESIDIVRSWLVSGGVAASRVQLSKAKGWLMLNATVEEAERLLKTQYNVYEHENGDHHIGCESYHLPTHVAPHVELVTPSVHFDRILKKRGSSVRPPARKIGLPGVGIKPKTTGTIDTIWNDLQNCSITITPICLRALYNFVHQPISGARNSYGIVEYTPQAYSQSDLDLFNQRFSKDLVGKGPRIESIDGGIVQTVQSDFDYNGESNLDLQYGMNLLNMFGAQQNVTLYQVGDLIQGGSFNNLLDALDGTYCSYRGGDDPSEDGIYPDDSYSSQDCGTIKPANVISTSYGYNEADLTPAYATRQCIEYGKLGLMGVTVLYSSGDNGVAGNQALCLNPDGAFRFLLYCNHHSIWPVSSLLTVLCLIQVSYSARELRSVYLILSGFPSTCPYVTSVGATQINRGAKVTDPESACQRAIASGGGFSNYFSRPWYQKGSVESYLEKYKPSYSSSIWNSTGIVEGQFLSVYGTSASTPVVGAMLTMINDARITVGKRPIGFINPVIYSSLFSGAFNDITSGSNPGCNTGGYTAVPGWDPVTGLGTPNFRELVSRWLILP
ncbi:LOW QUALITY PROTEIN: hypothetical protein CVT26_010074, partial [Gymnopilus dilepis]